MAELEQMAQYSLSGAWILDVSRSDTLEGYLRCLLLPEDVIQAKVAEERAFPTRNVIRLDKSSLVINRSTVARNVTEDFEIDEEQVIETNNGDIKMTKASLGESEQLDEFVLVSQTMSAQGPSLIHVEARQLDLGGHYHTQELNVRNLSTMGHCIVKRTWMRVPMTQEDATRLYPLASG